MKPLLLLLLALPPTQSAQNDVYSRPLRVERPREVDVLHYRIEIAFDEGARAFDGRTTITMTSLRDDLRSVQLDAETFRVERVEDASSRPLAFRHEDGALRIDLPSPASFGSEIELTVTYAATGVDVDSERYGLGADYDLGLDFKDATEDNPQLINTLSWPEGARHWFPSQDHPNDRASQEVIATVPDDYRVLSNGRLVSEAPGERAGTKIWHYLQELPHPTYLFVLVAGPYVVLDDALGDVPIRYWVYEKDRDDALRSFGKTPQMMAFFNREYGYDYPWVKYDQITIPGIGGGAESTGATVLGQSTIHDARAEQDFSSEGLVAHELAHQWWGDLVSYRDWSEAWMSESFATYGEHLYTRFERGEDEGAVNLLDKKNAYLREARERYQRPIVFRRWRYPNDNFDRHSYQKGAVVLSMLRFVLGEAAFRAATARFLEEHAFEPVDTHDFIDAIKEATGRDVEWFFDQWIYRPGHPVLEISREWDRNTGRVRLRVKQAQDRSGDVPLFRAPVDVGVETASSKTTHRIWLSREDETFELESREEPLLVRFDQGDSLLKEWTFPKPVDELLYQLRRDDVIGRMWAASELATHASSEAVPQALEEAMRSDPFWAVRRAAVESLGTRDVDVLKRAALDENSSVRVAALEALGETKDESLGPFLEDRFFNDDSYLVQAEAIRSSRRIGAASPALLDQAASMRSPRDVIARAAREAQAR